MKFDETPGLFHDVNRRKFMSTVTQAAGSAALLRRLG